MMIMVLMLMMMMMIIIHQTPLVKKKSICVKFCLQNVSVSQSSRRNPSIEQIEEISVVIKTSKLARVAFSRKRLMVFHN
jgi:hypothetical protein